MRCARLVFLGLPPQQPMLATLVYDNLSGCMRIRSVVHGGWVRTASFSSDSARDPTAVADPVQTSNKVGENPMSSPSSPSSSSIQAIRKPTRFRTWSSKGREPKLTTLIQSAFHARDTDLALSLITRFKAASNYTPSLRITNLHLRLCLALDNVDEAERVWKEAFLPKEEGGAGLKPNAQTYSRLILAYLAKFRITRPLGETEKADIVTDRLNDTRFLLGTDDSIQPPSEAISELPSSPNETSLEDDNEDESPEILEARAAARVTSLFEEMVSRNLKPSTMVLDAVLRAHFRRGGHDALLALAARFESSVHFDQRIFTLLIETLAVGKRDLPASYRFISKMVDRYGYRPDVHINTIMMNAHLAVGDSEGALRIFEELVQGMARGRTMTTSTSESSVDTLNGAQNKTYIRDEPNTLTPPPSPSSFDTIIPSLHTCGTIVHVLARAGQMETAQRFAREDIPRLIPHAKPNHVIYHTLLHGYASVKGDFASARAVLKEMKASGLKMLVTTFNILMGACVRHRDYKGCMAWYRALLDAEAADARPRVDGKVEAEADESRMETGRGIRPTLVTFNILVNAHVRMNQPDAAQAVLVEIAARRLVPDAATLLPLVDYFSRAGDWAAVVRVIEGARQVAEEVPGASFSGKERGRVPMREVVAHNVVMERMRRSGNLKGVLRRFLEVTTGGLDPRVTGTQEVEYIVEPDVRTYDILIRTLGMMRDVDSAYYWFKDALERRVLDTRLFNTMMGVYLHAEKVAETKEVYRMIEDYGAVPDEISVTLLLQASLPAEEASVFSSSKSVVAENMGKGVGSEDIAVSKDEGVKLEPTSKIVSSK